MVISEALLIIKYFIQYKKMAKITKGMYKGKAHIFFFFMDESDSTLSILIN